VKIDAPEWSQWHPGVGRIGGDHELLRVAAVVGDAARFTGRPVLHA